MEHSLIFSSIKKQIIYLLCFISLIFAVSCYKTDDALFNRITSNLELSIPLVDTTIEVKNFQEIKNSPEYIEIPADMPLAMNELSFPFYLGNFASTQEVEWIIPQIIADTKNLPADTRIELNVYVKANGEKHYFWIPESTPVATNSGYVTIPDQPVKVPVTDEKLRSANSVFMILVISFPEKKKVSELLSYKVNVKFAITIKLKTDLAVKL